MTKLRYLLILITSVLLSACSFFKTVPKTPSHSANNLQLSLNDYPESSFNQLSSSFNSDKSLQLTYLVISDIQLTPQWFDGLTSIELLKQINNNQFLLRSIIASPWPFKPRELITCVNTHFSQNLIDIKINSCSDKHPTTNDFVRVKRANAQWTISQNSAREVKVSYRAWLDPQGNVPAFFFNKKLLVTSDKSLQKLQHFIHLARKQDYAY